MILQQQKKQQREANEEKRKQQKLREFANELDRIGKEIVDNPNNRDRHKQKTIMDIVADEQAEEEAGDKTFFSKLFDNNIKPVLQTQTDVERFNPNVEYGLTKEQVEQRVKEGNVNKSDKKFSKSYKTIVLENVFTFFNILCFVLGGVLIYFGAYTDCVFLVVCIANMVIGLIQEIRAKQTINPVMLFFNDGLF